MPPVRTLVVWCPDWPLVAAGLADRPAVVVAANRVIASSASARAEGVRLGQRRREAQACCPELVVVGEDPGRDARSFEAVVVAVAAFTPRVEVTRPGACALPARAPARYFGGEVSLAEQVGSAAGAAVEAVAGAAGTAAPEPAVPGGDRRRTVRSPPRGARRNDRASWCDAGVARPISRWRCSACPHSLTCSDGSGSARWVSLPSWTTARCRHDLELKGVLPTGLPVVSTSDRSLSGTPRRTSRFAGSSTRPPTGLTPWRFVAVGLADELVGRLAPHGLAATQLLVEAETEHGESLQRWWRGDRPFTARAMVDRVRWQLEGWLQGPVITAPTAGVTLLRLTVADAVPDDGRQLDLEGGVAEASRQVERGLARVQGLLGHEAVLTAVRTGGRGPGEQIRLVPWGEDRSPATVVPARWWAASVPPWPGRLPPPSPTLVHPAPVPVEVLGPDGSPVGVTGRGRCTAIPSRLAPAIAGSSSVGIVGWAGPWPADERWWDPAAARRRARLQVLLDDGTAHLLILEQGQWRLEATYD